MITNPKFNAILLVITIALFSSGFSLKPMPEVSNISFYCKWKIRYAESYGSNTKTFYFITDVKTIAGDDNCFGFGGIRNDLQEKMLEQVKYNFPDLLKTPDRWHNLDGGKLDIEVVKNESKNEVDRLRRNDISAIRDIMKADDKLNNFIFDLDDLSCN